MYEANSLESYFGDMPDPWVIGRRSYPLTEIIIIAVCAVLSGAEGWEDIEEFGQSKEQWLRRFLELKNGIPSHDTFRRVFSLLDAQAFQARFIHWVEGVFTLTRGQVDLAPVEWTVRKGSVHSKLAKPSATFYPVRN